MKMEGDSWRINGRGKAIGKPAGLQCPRVRARRTKAATPEPEGEMPSVELIQNTWNEFAGKSDPAPKTTVKPAETPAPPKPKADQSIKPEQKPK